MKALICILIFPMLAWGEALKAEIKGFNFNYTDPSGEGEAEVFSYHHENFQSTQKVRIEKEVEDLRIILEGTEVGEFVLKKAPSVVIKASTFHLADFNLSFDQSLALSVNEANFKSEKNETQLNQVALTCAKDGANPVLKEQIIFGCIQKMTLKASKYASSSFTKTDLFEDLSDDRGNTTIKSLNLRMNGGKFDLQAEVKAQISGTAKGYGNMSYNPLDKVLTIKISEVKFGFLNVTSQVFSELKKKENAKFKVRQPNLFLTLE